MGKRKSPVVRYLERTSADVADEMIPFSSTGGALPIPSAVEGSRARRRITAAIPAIRELQEHNRELRKQKKGK